MQPLYEKCCCRCKQVKPLSEYHKNSLSKDGLAYNCKICAIEVSKAWRLQHPDYYKPKLAERQVNPLLFRAKERARETANRDRINTNMRRWRKNNPVQYKIIERLSRIRNAVKIKARKLLQYAVRKGKIVKPNVCSICGDVFWRQDIQPHHNDYSKPYEVVWVCRKCHTVLHRKYPDALLQAGAVLQ